MALHRTRFAYVHMEVGVCPTSPCLTSPQPPKPCLVPDRLLDTGNQEAIRKLFRRFPKAGAGVARLQVLLFSATLHSEEVRALARELCQDPILVDLRGKNHLPDTGEAGGGSVPGWPWG